MLARDLMTPNPTMIHESASVSFHGVEREAVEKPVRNDPDGLPVQAVLDRTQQQIVQPLQIARQRGGDEGRETGMRFAEHSLAELES